MPAMQRETNEKSRSVMRVELFSDAVFAIAMTLLVVELKVPDVHDTHPPDLTSALWKQHPSYLAFFITFFVLAIQWVDHHTMFSYVERCTPGLVWRNLVYLFCIVLLPFPTALLGSFSKHTPVLVLYAIVVGCCILTKLFLWRHVTRKGLMADALSRAYIQRATRIELWFFACVLILLALAFSWPNIAVYAWVLFGAIVLVVKVRSSNSEVAAPAP
jgi:uncharacterized membrane protein